MAARFWNWFMNLREQILNVAAFDSYERKREFQGEKNIDRKQMPLLLEGAENENARLTPLLTALADCVGAAEDAIVQIKDQRGLWPAEVDTLDDALASLRKVLGEK